MAAFLRTRDSFSRYIQLRRLHCFILRRSFTTSDVANTSFYFDLVVPERQVADPAKWKKVDARRWGITGAMIPAAPWKVLKVLRVRGFDSYLVGGCVRDLLMKKEPKDFDIITTAKLSQVKDEFRRSFIVGQRFPICMVIINGASVEVSSFETVSKQAAVKETSRRNKLTNGSDKNDFIRWRDSMHRDFTVNSLYYDPFKNLIYDYTSGMKDLKTLELRTLIPAQISFQEDCARILRGLRIAGRLGLTISEDIAIAIHEYSSSVASLGKFRVMMEINYMLAYGAAMSTIALLQKFHLLDKILPFHAAYLDQQDSRDSFSSCLMMKLFFHLDHHFSCYRPCPSVIWVSLLAFHQSLAVNPQHGLVVWAFASVLYFGNLKRAISFVRENAKAEVAPEISGFNGFLSDESLRDGVIQMAHLVQEAARALTVAESLSKYMTVFPLSNYYSTVFISAKSGRMSAQLFGQILNDIETPGEERTNFDLNYRLLDIGDVREHAFAIGKVILDTLSGRFCERLSSAEKDNQAAFSQTLNLETEADHRRTKKQVASSRGSKASRNGREDSKTELSSVGISQSSNNDRAVKKMALKSRRDRFEAATLVTPSSESASNDLQDPQSPQRLEKNKAEPSSDTSVSRQQGDEISSKSDELNLETSLKQDASVPQNVSQKLTRKKKDMKQQLSQNSLMFDAIVKTHNANKSDVCLEEESKITRSSFTEGKTGLKRKRGKSNGVGQSSQQEFDSASPGKKMVQRRSKPSKDKGRPPASKIEATCRSDKGSCETVVEKTVALKAQPLLSSFFR